MKLEEIIKAINVLSTFEDSKEIAIDELSKSDQEISDLLHFLENEKFNARDGYKIAKKIKEVRTKRRTAKNSIQLINTFQQNSNKLINSSNRSMLISALVKEQNKLSNLEYKYRILDINELLK